MKSLFFLFTRLHTLFFFIFLLTFPFNIRKAFLSAYSHFTGGFVEDATFFVNLSDIFLILTIIFAAVYIIKNNLRNVFLEFLKKYKYIFWILGALILWSFLGILYAKSQTLVLVGTVKILEFSVLFVYVTYFLRDFSKLLTSWRIIALSGVVQSIIAIIQYTIQKSLGLKILGESIIGRDLPGVAKIVIDGEKIIRPYGTFGHPNILGGFLIFSLSISSFLYLSKTKKSINISYFVFVGLLFIMFFDHYLVTNQQGQIILWLVLGMMFAISISIFCKGGLRGIKGNTLNSPNSLFQRGNSLSLFGDRTSKWWILPFIIIQFIALILTYSRTAWLAFGFVLACLTTLFFKKLVEKNLPKVLGILLIVLIILVMFLPFKTRIKDSFDVNNQAIHDRVLGIQTAFKFIKKHPFIGVGNKNYVINIDNYETRQLEYWQYQPVHNTYLLIWSELGLIGFVLFIVFAFFIAAHRFISRSAREDQK